MSTAPDPVLQAASRARPRAVASEQERTPGFKSITTKTKTT